MNESKSKSKRLPVFISVAAMLLSACYPASLIFVAFVFGGQQVILYVIASIVFLIAGFVSFIVMAFVIMFLCMVLDKEEPKWVEQIMHLILS